MSWWCCTLPVSRSSMTTPLAHVLDRCQMQSCNSWTNQSCEAHPIAVSVLFKVLASTQILDARVSRITASGWFLVLGRLNMDRIEVAARIGNRQSQDGKPMTSNLLFEIFVLVSARFSSSVRKSLLQTLLGLMATLFFSHCSSSRGWRLVQDNPSLVPAFLLAFVSVA